MNVMVENTRKSAFACDSYHFIKIVVHLKLHLNGGTSYIMFENTKDLKLISTSSYSRIFKNLGLRIK